MVTRIVSVPITCPLPPHCLHGFPTCPCPLQRGQALVNCMGPWATFSRPDPPQVVHVDRVALGSVPLPLQPAHASGFCIAKFVSNPLRAETRSIVISCSISLPEPAMGAPASEGPPPKPNMSPKMSSYRW